MTAVEEPDLVARLISQPRDHGALEALYASLAADPQRYAATLERAALACDDAGPASHYLTEAARTTFAVLRDVPEACRLLGRAVELDARNERAAELLAQIVATELRRTDYGGLLRRRAVELDALAKRDAGLVWLASDAWEQIAKLIVASGGEVEEAMRAMSCALECVRRTFRASGVPESMHREGYGRDTIRTPNPASALVSRPDSSDEAPTRPRGPVRDTVATDSVAEDEDERPTETDLRVAADAGHAATIPSPRPAEHATPTEPPAAGSAGRLVGLFESLHEVTEKRSVGEAAERLADLVRRKVGARAAVVHTFDSTSGDYVVAAASGAYDRKLLASRTPAADPELSRALVKGAAIRVDVGPRGALEAPRWAHLEPKRSVLVASACIDGQTYGAIELCDPLDRGQFDTEDEHALTYVGERWAEFLSERGGF